MNILILGSTGLIGNFLFQKFNYHQNFEIFSLSRKKFNRKNHFTFDVINNQNMQMLNHYKFDIIFNCLGYNANNDNVLQFYKKYEFEEMKNVLMEWLEPSETETTDEDEAPFDTTPQTPAQPAANYTLNTKAKKGFNEDEFDDLFND